MNTKLFNLGLMVFWILLCVGLLTREWWMPPDLLDKVSGPQTPLVIMVAAVLAMWNFMRFFIAHRFTAPARPSPVVDEYRRKIRRESEDPKVTDPQFRFDDPNNPPGENR